MSGLVRGKKYDWKDSNMSLFGSDEDRAVKKESAMAEPAWQGAGEEVGLKIWRIVKFEVTEWPKEDYGKFYSGDSYIVLNTYKKDPDGDALAFDLHFWIGSRSTQDEYGSAAYKTVELDCYLDDAAVQHREVMGHESDLFEDYFDSVLIMEGGAETGFRHVETQEYQPRLLHFSGKRRKVNVIEVPLCPSRLNDDDVFILDSGTKLIQWNGRGANKDEKWKALEWVNNVKSERFGKAEVETVEQDETHDEHEFYTTLSAEDEDDCDITDDGHEHKLLRVSDASGEMSIDVVKEGSFGMEDLEENDVFIADLGKECFVWVGSEANTAEFRNGMAYAHNVLKDTTHPFIPITVVKQGNDGELVSALNALAA